MSPPLIDVDVSSRQPDLKPIRTSRIPNPRMANSIGSIGRRSPFSVSATGSPRYTAASLPSRTARVSPAITSKIPRKGQTPTQASVSKITTQGNGAIQQQHTLSRSCSGRNAPMKVSPSYMDVKKPSPASFCDKPLPSPPVAQVIDPNSPLKAQRTLVDAEAGSPTDEEWPILRPENVSPVNQLAMQQQRSTSEGSKLRQLARPSIKTKMTEFSTASTLCMEANTSPLSTQSAESSDFDVMQTTSRGLGSRNPHVSTFHAISTRTKVAMESPLAHKKSTAISIPPRISSKRNSLPLLSDDTPASPVLPSSVTLRHTKSVESTKWPVLMTKNDNNIALDDSSSMPNQQTGIMSIDGSLSSDAQEHLHNTFEPVSGCNMMSSQYGSIDSNSTWSVPAESSLGNEPHNGFESSIRIKRLSWHSSASGKGSVTKKGPVLMIDGDADAVLLGSSESIPEIPALPEQVPEQVPEQILPPRSLSASAERVPGQTLAETSLDNLSQISTPSTTKNGAVVSSSTKINPIRSMQPPRKTSAEAFIHQRSSPITTTSIESDKARKLSIFSSITKNNMPGFTKKKTATPNSIPMRVKSSLDCNIPDQPVNIESEETDIKTNPFPHVSLSIDQDFSTGSETHLVPLQSRLRSPLLTPTDKFRAKKTDIHRSKINSSTSERLDNCKSTSAQVASGPISSTAHDTAYPLTGSCYPSLPKLGVTTSSTRCRELAVVERRAPSNRLKQSPQSILVSSSFTVNQSSVENLSHNTTNAKDTTSKKIKVKRSFRDIFHRREVKRTEKPPKPTETEQSSVAGSTFTRRFRNPTTLSKVSMPKKSESRSYPIHESTSKEVASETVTKNTERQAALSCLEGASVSPVSEVPPALHCDTASVINQIITRVTSMPSDSPDRLRGLEIAEAVLHAIECSKEARVSAEMAKKYARDAELNAERAAVELRILQKLCEPEFDGETLAAIKGLVENVGLAGGKGVAETVTLST